MFSRGKRFDPKLVSWQFDVYEWLFENFGGHRRFLRQTLVTPTPDFFPFIPSRDAAYVEGVFDIVKSYMGMEDWMCTLLPLDDGNPMRKLRQTTNFYGTSGDSATAAGLFQLDRHGAKIYYNTSQLENPTSLIATLSHELSHYLLSSTVTSPPGGWAKEEPMTDLTSVFRGFGIFLANSSFNLVQWGDHTGSGWKADTLGYLNETELALGLAIFCSLHEIPYSKVKKHLKPNPRSDFKKALKEMRFYPHRLDRLRKVVAIPERS